MSTNKSLFETIHEDVKTIVQAVENISENMSIVFEGFTDSTISELCESAATVLGQISAQIKFKGQVDNLEHAVDMLTAFKLLGIKTNREAFNVNTKTFSVLLRKAGESASADSALQKLARHPSAQSVRKEIEEMLSTLPEIDDNKMQEVLRSINKLRMGYERVQNIITSRQDNGQPKKA